MAKHSGRGDIQHVDGSKVLVLRCEPGNKFKAARYVRDQLLQGQRSG